MAILICLLYIFRFQIFYTIVLYNENYITNLHAHACVCLYVYIHKCEQSEMKKLIFVFTGEERTHFFGSVTFGSGSLQEKEPIGYQTPELRGLLSDQMLEWSEDIPEQTLNEDMRK